MSYCDESKSFIAEPLGEAGNRGARSRNVFVCMYNIILEHTLKCKEPR